ncbi:hypothetical protein SAMN05216215_1006117 [Saccharopolyspora shandongensis]|uniref:Uncharacterized protein n=1 Tax=Saccharopolyspora shandongensis TaxID=418495 RepID=A0A1H2XLT5_9PSEU|nr:hypothetical protein [Saccharopolyspora shandongensis]SDW93249.1 hypothetical protein SAMN05216215_1006117 [Saccharopolyspora shandongensis]
MLAEVLAALAGAGGTAVVGAMATDAWEGTRDGVARLFSRGGEDRQRVVEAQLDEDAEVLNASASPEEQDQVRRELAPVWTRRLSRLLEEHPDAEGELREVVDRVQEELPGGARSWTQTNIARDGATQFAVQGGNVIYHQARPAAEGDAPES